MRRYWTTCLSLTCVPLLMGQAAPAPASFDFAGMRFVLPIPPGYCRPQGNAALLLRRMAEIDTQNIVHLMLASCGDT